jgi:hypothetical protein
MAPRIPSLVSLIFCLAACDDGRLDVLEPLATGGTPGASGTAGDASGGTGNASMTGGTNGDGGRDGPGQGGRDGSLPSPFLLDDFEDGDTKSANIPDGYWYVQTDRECDDTILSIEATEGPFDETQAIRVRGDGCRDFGALLGLDLDSFDASSFDALRLWARAESDEETEVSVSLLAPNHFDAAIRLDGEWREFEIPFDEFMFNDREPEDGFDIERLEHLQFFIVDRGAFDYWLDDLAFVRFD